MNVLCILLRLSSLDAVGEERDIARERHDRHVRQETDGIQGKYTKLSATTNNNRVTRRFLARNAPKKSLTRRAAIRYA